MSVLVVGSIAFDDVETPSGSVIDSPGGSGLYFSCAASFFTSINVVGVVGTDFDFSLTDFLKVRNVDLNGLYVEEGKTFRWGGKYHQDLNRRDTLFTDLNVFEKFNPTIPQEYRKSEYIFLANIDPEIQLQVLSQIEQPKLIILDTMNFWIDTKLKILKDVIKKCNVLILNDEEARELTGKTNLLQAGKEILKMGPDTIIIKKGEHGAVLMTQNSYFFAPAFPLDNVVDPTGAGDTFAGGFVGYVASQDDHSEKTLRKAVIYGSTIASFNVEDFSFNRLKELSKEEIEERIKDFEDITRY